ncbi:LysR family transcriptional regulator [uncultured Parasutterella sp.]|uniref:LysR family transcriptional regulator n=1 Tax=uncultured Parasutterella sp. TaxID=1263098 RepID=UPI0034A40080
MAKGNPSFTDSFYASEVNWNIFLALAHFRSYTRTAAYFGSSQSTITKSIQKMEKHLGFELINREKRPVSLTPEGLALRDELLSASKRINGALNKIYHNRRIAIALRFGCVESACRFVIPDIVIKMGPKLAKFSQTTGNSLILLEQLLNGELDIALVASDFSDCENISRIEVYREPSILVFPNSVPDQDNWTWEELKKLQIPLIFSSETSAAGKLNRSFLSRMKLSFDNHCEIDSDEAMIGLIEAGYSWAITRPSTLFAAHHPLRSIRVKRLPPPGFDRRLFLIAKQDSFSEELSEITAICKSSLENKLKTAAEKLFSVTSR